MIQAKELIGTHHIVWIILDTLRYDVAEEQWSCGRTPTLARWLPTTGWEKRHSPGNFTFAAHTAFFAGFLPTPVEPGKHPRLFALTFPGSETTVRGTAVFDAPDIVTGLAQCGYHTICIGGVGFFNQQTPLGNVLPALFHESHWRPELGVTEPRSTEYQIDQALASIGKLSKNQKFFLFMNVSAIHQPNCAYIPGQSTDSLATHTAALEYVDGQLGRLFDALAARRPLFGLICSDHGTAYGEEGYRGHRLAHPVVWTVPYAEFQFD